MMKSLLICCLLVFSFCTQSATAQRKFDGRTVQIDLGPTIPALIVAGENFREWNIKFTGSDTLRNAKIIFSKCVLTGLDQVKVQFIVERGIVVQFQVNVFTSEQTKKILKACDDVYGKAKKTSNTKTNSMFVWESINKRGVKVQTVLITGNKSRKAELVSWEL